MRIFERLKQLFVSAGTDSLPLMPVVVRCSRCGQVIRGQVNLRNDLSVEYDGDRARYFCRKGLSGSGDNRCFQVVEIEYTFDADRRLIKRQIQGGTFVDEGE